MGELIEKKYFFTQLVFFAVLIETFDITVVYNQPIKSKQSNCTSSYYLLIIDKITQISPTRPPKVTPVIHYMTLIFS